MSGIDLDAIRARAAAATEGPWEVYTTRDDHMNTVGPRRQPTEYDSSDHVNLADASQGGEGGIWADADAEFIAHAREDIPALLDEVERLRVAIAGSPEMAKRLASLVASATRLVQIERDDARAERDRAEATIARVRKLADSWDDVIAEERNQKRTWCAGMFEAAQSDLRAAIEGTDS